MEGKVSHLPIIEGHINDEDEVDKDYADSSAEEHGS